MDVRRVHPSLVGKGLLVVISATIPMKRSEGTVQRAVLDLLSKLSILAFRMNTGAVHAEHKGRRRFVRFGFPGMADIIAFPRPAGQKLPRPVWIECKSSDGKQSDRQWHFQRMVEEEGHTYLLVRSAAEVYAWLKENRVVSQ